MKRNYLFTLLFLLVAILLPNEVWAWRGATAVVKSEPTSGGFVYVTKDANNVPSSSDLTRDESSNSNNRVSAYTFTFYRYPFPNNGYVFKGWATSTGVNTGDTQTSVGIDGNLTNYNTVTYYAIFARLAADVSELNFDVERPNTLTKEITISHSHAGKITAALSGNDADKFAISTNTPVENSVSETNTTIMVTYEPDCNGTHTATLTLNSNNGLNPVTITLKGTASLIQGQKLSWVEPINTNILKGTTAKIEATATSGLGVTYTSDNTNVLTVDADGNITAVGEGGATITASQAGDCTYAAATSITKTFTVSDKKTPTFWLENDPDLKEKNLMVDGTTTINITNIDTESFNADYDINLLDFSLVDGVATITAKNAGTATLTLTQTETNAVFAASSVFTFHISKYTGTLTNNLGATYKVDDAVNIVDCYTASNSEVDVQVASSNTDVIAVVEGQLKAVGAGTATVTFKQAETYKWTELTASQEITVTKYDLSASISQSTATWDATINNPFAISYGLNDYAVEARDPDIATYTNGAIQTYAETGTAHFVISRAEDYKYNQLAETLSISVIPRAENCTYEILERVEVRRSSYDYVLPYACNKISVQFSIQSLGVGGYITLKGYASDGTWIQDICSLDRDKLSSSAYLYDIDTRIRKIQFYADGTGDTYAQNFIATRDNFLTPSVAEVSMSSTIGTNAEAKVGIDYSSCGGTVKVVSDNPKITVSPASFNAEGSGTQEITLTGDATVLGTETATITIYDQSKKTTINVTSTITRIPQTITWNSSFENLDVFKTVALDATGATTVTYSIVEEDQAKAAISENVLSFNEAGTVHVVATAAQSDRYEGVSDTVSVEVRLAQPEVSVLPTVEAVTYGTALTNAMLQGGVAKYGETTVEGSFAWADERITDRLTPNTYSFNVRFTPADATHYSTVDCTVEVTVEKAQQAIVWQSSFADLNVLSEVSLSATAQTTVRFEVSNSEVATITGDLLTFLKAGVVDVVAIAAESDLYQQAADTIKGVVIAKIDPVVSQWPTATLTYGETLADVVLAGESAYKGTFRWGDTITTAHLDAVKTAGVYTYQVKFVPDNSEQFNTVYGEATITIEEASQTISWENYPSMCNVGDQITLAAVASSRLPVEYFISQNGNYATIEPGTNILTALAQGTITLEVNQRGEEGKYLAAEPMRLPIQILPKQATSTNSVTEQEQADIRKVMRDGVLYILRDGQYYDTCGRRVSIE